jgi:Sulfotransferase family
MSLRAPRYVLSQDSGHRPSVRTIAIRLERLRRRDRWRYSPRRRFRSVDRIRLDRPIFVLGLQGGGTTLLSRCLLRHPLAVSMSGNSSYWVATDELGFVRNRMAALPPSLWSSSHRTDVNHPMFGTEHRSVWASDDLLPVYRRDAGHATADDAERFKRLLREHIAVYARNAQDARFVDKTHTNTVKIPYLDALLDGCDPYFVLVVRSPYTMCVRSIDRKPPSWRLSPPYEEQLAIAAQHWENAFRLALHDGAQTGRFAAVRFEDLLRDTEATVRELCLRIDLAYDPALVPRAADRLPFATLPTDEKWYPLRTEILATPVENGTAEIIEARCLELARRLGYGRDGTYDAEPSPFLVTSMR